MLDGLRTAAAAAGLNVLWVLARDPVEAAYSGHSGSPPPPSRLHPTYRRVIVLASSGSAFWRGLRATHAPAPVPNPARNPLDRHTRRTVESLAQRLRVVDRTVTTVYPFRHARQLLGFRLLLGDAPWAHAPAPFGVTIAPELGPWWALRGAMLTRLEFPPDPPRGESPCHSCHAPCIDACPAHAVHKDGLHWRSCAEFRLDGPTCATVCQARLACPVAASLRYDEDAIDHHGTASLRELRRHL